MEPKRLYRSVSDRKIAGVAGGLGEYFLIDPLLIRLIFVVLLLAGGGGFLIYLVLWIVTPENPHYGPAYKDHQDPPSVKEGETTSSTDPDPADAGTTPDQSNPSAYAENNIKPNPKPVKGHQKKGSVVGGLVLITIGALFLIDELIPQLNFGDLWPLILVAIGVGLLISAFSSHKTKSNN